LKANTPSVAANFQTNHTAHTVALRPQRLNSLHEHSGFSYAWASREYENPLFQGISHPELPEV
jgi:hypothetical protein